MTDSPDKTAPESVKDFATNDALFKALKLSSDTFYNGITSFEEEDAASSTANATTQTLSDTFKESVDTTPGWLLSSYDSETTRVNTYTEEYRRLQVLKSYMVLDAAREQAFDRLTSLAARIFEAPVALISLVDLERLYILSNQGLGDIRQIPRKDAFCAHAVMNKGQLLVVPDATADFRFKDSPIVTGPPGVRFYAGAPLFTPEGYKVGNFCIIDTKARPGGLSDQLRLTLLDLAAMTVEVLVTRKYRLETKDKQEQLVAYASHDLMTPLQGLNLSLTLLKEEDENKKLEEHQAELVSTAILCADVMTRICQATVQDLRGERPKIDDPMGESSNLCVLTDLVHCFRQIMDPIPKKVPVMVSVDPELPDKVICDDLTVFRALLNFVSTACARTESGSISIKLSLDDNSNLRLECQDTAPDVSDEDTSKLFRGSNIGDYMEQSLVGLHAAARLVDSVNGKCGFHPRYMSDDGSQVTDASGRRKTGSVFWFCLPVSIPAGAQRLGDRWKREDPKPVRAGLPQTPIKSATKDGFGIDTSKVLSFSVPYKPDQQLNGKANADIRGGLSSVPMPSARQVEKMRELPMKAIPSVPTKMTGAVPMSSDRQRKALVIDDSMVIRKTISKALSSLGYDVTVAVDGMEGLRALKETIFDLTFCDFLMPVMDGFDCVKQYREWEAANRPNYKQYIVGISAHAGDVDSNKGIEAGMDDFRPKPVSRKTLKDLHESETVARIAESIDEMLCENATESSTDGSDLFSVAEPARNFCLIVTADASEEEFATEKAFESNGWQCEIVRNGVDALRFLKIRNWDCVLIDEEFTGCINDFRVWEADNRVNRQNNILLHCTIDSECPAPGDPFAVVQPPMGFDGALRKPLQWTDFSTVVERPIESSCGMGLCIITR